MARPRAAQFGRDIGVSTAGAKKLINEGRRRNDGGSQVLERHMSEMKEKVTPPRPLPPEARARRENSKMYKKKGRPNPGDRNERKNPGQTDVETREAAMGTYVEASDGKYMSCRGMGAAIKGGKFSGTK